MRGLTATKNYVKQNHVVNMTNKAVVELNMNRYLTVSSFGNKADIYGTADIEEQEYFEAKFNVDNIVKPHRPRRAGIVKPRARNYSGNINGKWWSQSRANNVNLCATYNSSIDGWTLIPRLYVVGSEDRYEYFAAAVQSPYVEMTYDAPVSTNKFYMLFEATLDKPLSVYIEYRDTLGDWNLLCETAPDADGRIVYYRKNNTWSTTPPTTFAISDAIQITGIRFSVDSMTQGHYPAIIEVSPRLVVDVTSRLISWSTTNNLAEDDALTPLGTVSANNGEVLLDNTDYAFNDSGSLNILTRRWANVVVTSVVNNETIYDMDMYVDSHSTGDGDAITLSMFDYSLEFQSIQAPDMLLTKTTPTAAIWRILDSVGFNDVVIKTVQDIPEQIIDWYWTTSQQNVWECIKEICRGYQCAVTFDNYGKLNIMSKEYLYDRTFSSQWDFYGQTEGAVLANIEEHEAEPLEVVNKAIMKFKPMKPSRSNDPDEGQYKNTSTVAYSRMADRVLYSPENPVLLGAARVTQAMDDTQTYMYIDSTALSSSRWGSFSGYMMYDQECIKFDGMQYQYLSLATGAYKTVTVKSKQQLSEVYSDANGTVNFTGRVENLTRGALLTRPAAHGNAHDSFEYPASIRKYFSITSTPGRNADYYMNINCPIASPKGLVAASKVFDSTYSQFATEITLLSGTSKQRSGGIVMFATIDAQNVVQSGYYLEISSSKVASKEIAVMPVVNGVIQRNLGGFLDCSIKEGDPYRVSVYTKIHPTLPSYRQFRIKINGTEIGHIDLLDSVTPGTAVSIAATGRSNVRFNYLAVTGYGLQFDSTHGGTMKDIIEILLRGRTALRTKKISFVENFDDVAKEVYVADVRFSKYPAISYYWFPTVNGVDDPKKGGRDTIDVAEKKDSTGKVVRSIFVAKTYDIAAALDNVTPFGASIRVTNLGQIPVILSETDSGLYPLISGVIVEQYEEIEVSKENKTSLGEFGEKKLEISNQWITSRETSEHICQWIVDRAGQRLRKHSMRVFSNPLLEPGDQVYLKFDRIGLARNAVVTSVKQSFDQGLVTQIECVEL